MTSRGNIISNLKTKIILFPLTFFVSIIVARILGPSDQGQFSFAVTFISIATLFVMLGFDFGTYYEISTKRSKVENVFFSGLIVNLLISILIGIIFLIFYRFSVFPLLNKLSIFHFVLIWIYLLFGILYTFISKILIASDQFVFDNRIRLYLGIIRPFLLVFFVVLLDMKLLGSFFSIAILSLLSFILIYYKFKTLFKSYHYIIDKEYIKRSFNYGVQSWFGNVAYMAALRLDLIILSFYVSPFQVGIYAISVSLMETLWLIPDSVNSVLLNKISNPEDTILKKIENMTKVLKMLIAISLSLAFLLFIFTKYFLVPFGYGVEYSKVIESLMLLLPGGIFFIMFKVISKLFSGIGLVKITSIIVLFGSSMGVILYMLLIPKMGILGASIGTSISYFFIALFSVFYFQKHFPHHTKSLFTWSINDLKLYYNELQLLIFRKN